MFTRKSSYLKSDNLSPELFIDGYDYSNSQLLYQIDIFTDWQYYFVSRYERRIDMISKDIYNDIRYSWLLLYMNKIENNDIIRNMQLRYIEKDTLDSMISSL